ncbi:hypothetical protein Hanom_Chr11g00999761 [Helianthus anomalus]
MQINILSNEALQESRLCALNRKTIAKLVVVIAVVVDHVLVLHTPNTVSRCCIKSLCVFQAWILIFRTY